jgi:diketogulonate reductase-like aldo/keto reductase
MFHSIGVSNFSAEHIQKLIDSTGVAPAVNQGKSTFIVEMHCN